MPPPQQRRTTGRRGGRIAVAQSCFCLKNFIAAANFMKSKRRRLFHTDIPLLSSLFAHMEPQLVGCPRRGLDSIPYFPRCWFEDILPIVAFPSLSICPRCVIPRNIARGSVVSCVLPTYNLVHLPLPPPPPPLLLPLFLPLSPPQSLALDQPHICESPTSLSLSLS